MKVNINKYQSGGAFVQLRPLFSSKAPQGATYGYGQDVQSSQTKKSLVDEESDDMLKKGGLTSDYYVLINDLGKLEENPMSFIDPQTSGKAVRAMRGRINEMINNKSIWEDSVKSSRQNGSFNEIAVGTEGQLYYRDSTGNIVTKDLSSIQKMKEIPNFLTVSELLDERQKNVGLAFDQNVFGIANSSVGLKQITEHITGLFDTLSQYSDKSERTYNKEDLKTQYNLERDILSKSGIKPTQQEILSIQRLSEKINSPGNFIKEELEVSGKGRDLNSAFNYIWKTLGSGAQNKLKATAILQGESVNNLIGSMLLNYGAQSSSSIITPVKESETKDISEEKNMKALDTFELFHNRKLFSPNTKFAMNDPKLGVMFRGAIAGISPGIDSSGNTIQNATLGDVLKKAGYGNFLQTDKIFFGDKKVSSYEQDSIIYDEQDMGIVYMPISDDGMPDYDLQEEFKNIYSVYEANKDSWTVKQAEEYFRKNNYKVEIDERMENGKIQKVIKENSEVKPFLVLYGYTNDATNLIENNSYATKLSDEEEGAIIPKLEMIWTYGSGKNAVNTTPNKKWNRENYYKGIITIPYREGSNAIVSSMVGNGPKDKTPFYSDVQRNLKYSSGQMLNSGNASELTN